MLDYTGNEIHTGNRVELSPSMDLWMAGYRYGTVTKIGRSRVHVTVERLAATRATTVHPINVKVI